jgi:hypothetical protein
VDISSLSHYFVLVVIGVCCCIGYIIKTSLDFIPNKYIPLILAIVGVITNCVLSKGFSIDILLGGMMSALASTGCHQMFKNLITFGDKIIEEEEDDDNEN